MNLKNAIIFLFNTNNAINLDNLQWICAKIGDNKIFIWLSDVGQECDKQLFGENFLEEKKSSILESDRRQQGYAADISFFSRKNTLHHIWYVRIVDSKRQRI